LKHKNKSQPGDEDFVCRYRLDYDSNRITMISDCKECGRGREPSLNNQICLTGILNGLCQELNVDSVILSHYIETKYAEESMQMLKMMVEIVHDLEQMSIRNPFVEYFANDSRLTSSFKNQQKSACEKCELKPEKVFTRLKKHFLRDISTFYNELNNFSKQVETYKKSECAKCIKTTKSDLIYLFNKLENFRAYVIYKGFQIVI
jgi:hypothetical protein